MATSSSLKTAVKKEVKEAEHKASTGNVSTTKAPPDLKTGQRRGHEPGEAAPPAKPYLTGPNPGALARDKATGDLPTGARSHLVPD